MLLKFFDRFFETCNLSWGMYSTSSASLRATHHALRSTAGGVLSTTRTFALKLGRLPMVVSQAISTSSTLALSVTMEPMRSPLPLVSVAYQEAPPTISPWRFAKSSEHQLVPSPSQPMLHSCARRQGRRNSRTPASTVRSRSGAMEQRPKPSLSPARPKGSTRSTSWLARRNSARASASRSWPGSSSLRHGSSDARPTTCCHQVWAAA
mmetsp:Transcript_15092/g.51765  ORF Transcript_15092/g.51765 Transcript_15092/m.51765 type:complete len:208 (-) Transcript_15092:346-969(-)